MKRLAVEFPLARLCEVFELWRSGYYAWLKRKPSRRQWADQQLLPRIHQAYAEGRGAYGSPRVTHELKARRQQCGRHRVARLMRQAGLRGEQKPAFRPRTTDSNHAWPIAPNRLKDAPPPQAPDQVWVSDITYIATGQGWLYLAVVMDLCSRKIVGWALADHLKTPLVSAALRRALAARRPGPGLVHHSDRGVQYASGDYQKLLAAWQILPSMSAQGNCYDNAAAEAFFSTLKRELLHRQRWHSAGEVELALFDYLESFYNRKRLHSALAYRSPAQFERTLAC
jgi:transposase InsO family protein